MAADIRAQALSNRAVGNRKTRSSTSHPARGSARRDPTSLSDYGGYLSGMRQTPGVNASSRQRQDMMDMMQEGDSDQDQDNYTFL